MGFGCLHNMIQLIVLMDFAVDWILKWPRKDLTESRQFGPTSTFVNKYFFNFYYCILSWDPRRLKKKKSPHSSFSRIPVQPFSLVFDRYTIHLYCFYSFWLNNKTNDPFNILSRAELSSRTFCDEKLAACSY